MKVYLVLNKNDEDLFLSYVEKYQIFTDENKAFEHAKSIGYQDQFGMGINTRIGMYNSFSGGDEDGNKIEVSIIALEIQE